MQSRSRRNIQKARLMEAGWISPVENGDGVEEGKIILDYFSGLKRRIGEQYEVARLCREKGKDAVTEIECPPTLDLADRTENIIGPVGIAKRYRELYKELDGNRNKVIFQVFREIVEQKICNIPDDEKRL